MIKNVLIIEDEMIIAASLQICLEELGYKVVDIADSLKSVSQLINREPKIDLALLDINLGNSKDYNGIDIGRFLQKNGIHFMYLTSYADKDTVSKALDTQPLGYLLKPLCQNSLFSQIELIKKKLANRIFFIKDAGIVHKVNCDMLLYIQAEGNYTNIFFTHKKLVLRKSLTKLESMLPDMFIQTHKAYLVNCSKIAKIESQEVFLTDGSILPLSRHYKALVIETLQEERELSAMSR